MVALLVSVVFVALGPAPAASAHATLLFTTPAVDGAVPTSPQTLQLVFDETVAPSASSLSLEASSGRAYSLGTVTSGDKGQTISAPVPSRLPVGQYLVRWQVGAEDGDTMRGEYRFAVGSTSGLTPGTAAVGTRGLAATSLLRWALFAGLSLALGGLVGSWLVSRSSGRTERLPAPLPWARAGAIMGAVACAGLALLILGGGSLWHGLSLVSPEALMSSSPGRLAGLELVAFVVAAALLWGGRRVLAVMFLLVVPVAEGLRAHPQGSVPGLGAMLTGVHLAAAAVWVGALVHVIRVGRARRRVGAPAAGLVRSYARLALWLFLVVVLSGTISALILIPRGELTATLATTTYGRWLVVKVVFLAVVAGLALLARRFVQRSLSGAQPALAAHYEAGVLLVILCISGLLTSLAPPVVSDTPLPFPPPAVGPVVSVGSRAGFIGIGVTASSGQLLVRLTTPDSTPGVDSETDPSLKLSGNIATGLDDEASKLGFRRCGTGCFVAPTRWAKGLSTVTLRPSSGTWAGGTTAVSVAWPPDSATARLASVVAAMRTVHSFVVHEQITSDTTTGMSSVRSFPLSGSEFLATGPYGSGVATSATVLSEQATQTTLALGYPAEATYVLLTVDADQRIIRETLAAPKHLISRTFVYPGPDAD